MEGKRGGVSKSETVILFHVDVRIPNDFVTDCRLDSFGEPHFTSVEYALR